MDVGIIGASGLSGTGLLALIAKHPEFDVKIATSNSKSGRLIKEVFPNLSAPYPEKKFDSLDFEALEQVDLIFFCLPHGNSQQIVKKLKNKNTFVIDIGPDFRFLDPKDFEAIYNKPHAAIDIQRQFATVIPEINFQKTAKKIALPGCYVTCACLGLYPFIKNDLIEGPVIIDAASGVSGAGSELTPGTQFINVDSNFKAYGLINHRHKKEIEMFLKTAVVFTPHLVPMTRGILATSYAKLKKMISKRDSDDMLKEHYKTYPFVHILDVAPGTKDVLGTNNCFISSFIDPNTGYLIVISAIDNLIKGAAGQALQVANLLCDYEETLGLETIGLYP
jgi:N-acetyl-gamma-glutamyl-phosphate reductase